MYWAGLWGSSCCEMMFRGYCGLRGMRVGMWMGVGVTGAGML